MEAKYVNQACIEAALQCPQFKGFPDKTEIEYWNSIGYGCENVPKLHKEGLARVIEYWLDDEEGSGGEILWGYDYYKFLPDDIKELFMLVEHNRSWSLKKILKKIKKGK